MATLLRPLVLLILAALLLAGCGGDSGDTDQAGDSGPAAETSESPSSESAEVEPAAFASEESLDDFVARFEAAIQALQQGDCPPVLDFMALSDLGLPCEEQVAKDFADFKVTGSEEYDGLGATVTFESARGPGVVVAVADVFGMYEPAAILPAPVELGTEPDEVEQRQQDLQKLLDAFVNQDCDDFFTYALTSSDDKETECSRTFAAGTEQSQAELEAAGAPELVGGNEFAAFFTVTSGDPESVRVYYSVPDPEKPVHLAKGRRLGPADSGVTREQAVGLLSALNDSYGPGRGEFVAEAEGAASVGNLEDLQRMTRSYRDAAFDLDARIRELGLGSVAVQSNAVLWAIGDLIGTLDEILALGDASQAAPLVDQALEDDAALETALGALISAMNR